MSDTLGRISIPDSVDSGLTFPLVSDFGYGLARPKPIVVHRFGELATKAEQRFEVGIGPRRFQFRASSLSQSEHDDLFDFYEEVQGSYKLFNYSAPDSAQSFTSYKVRFEDPPLSIQALVDAATTGITFVEHPDPSTAPTYGITATNTRFPDATLETALLDQAQRLIPLVHIRVLDPSVPDIYLSDRRCTVGGILYLPRLLNIGESGSDVIMTQTITGAADSVTLTFGNGDRAMTLLRNDCALKLAEVELCWYHINTGILLQFWSGFIQDVQTDGSPICTVRCSDGTRQVNLLYPNRNVAKECWKTFNDGRNCDYAKFGAGGDPLTCDYTFDGPNGCYAHTMDVFFGGHPAQPDIVRIKDNSSGTWGLGRNIVAATSIVSDSVWGNVLPEIWCNDFGDPRKAFNVKCMMIAARDESDFLDGLGIVGAGPIGKYTGVYIAQNADGYRYLIGSTLDGSLPFDTKVPNGNINDPDVHIGDGQLIQMVGRSGGIRQNIGNDPGLPGGWHQETNEFLPATFGTGRDRDVGAGYDTQDEAFGLGAGNPPTFSTARAAGTAFIELRRSDTPGIQPSLTDEHQMETFISQGLVGWTWDAAGNRTPVAGLTNPFWIVINSYLRALGLFSADSATQLDTFVLSSVVHPDGVSGCAQIADLVVPSLFGTGTEIQFQFQGILAQQKPFRDQMTEILNSCLGYFTWEFGRLRLGIRENASAVQAFTRGNMLHQSLAVTEIAANFERMIMDFADQNYQYQANIAQYWDKDYSRTYGRSDAPQTSRIRGLGVPNGSQASRIIATRVREEIGGVNAAEWTAARNIVFKSTILAASCAVGQVIEISDPEVPGGLAKYRILQMRWLKDWSIEFTCKSVTVSMYDLDFGPKPADVVPLPLPAAFFPIPQGQWAPYKIQASATDPLFPSEWTFDMGVNYLTLADNKIKATAPVIGRQPINEFYPGSSSPVIHRGQIRQSTTGGFIKGGKIYRISVCALTDDGRCTPASEPLYVATTPDTDTHDFVLSDIEWPKVSHLTKYVIFAADVDDLICYQMTGDLSGDSTGYTPVDITVTSGPTGGPFERSTWAVPDRNQALVRLKQKVLTHGGTLGAPITVVAGTSITASQTVDIAAIDNWVGRYIIIIGRPTGSVPFCSFLITGFNAATGEFTSSRDFAAAGVLPGDVFIVTFKGYDNSANMFEFEDLGISNALNFDVITDEPTPHSGLTVNQDKGMIARIIYGFNRGAYAKIMSNTATKYTFDRELLLDATSILIVESAAWDVAIDSTRVNNAGVENETTIPVPLENYFQKSVLMGGFTVNNKSIESGETDAVFRMLYVYGGPGIGAFEKATFNIRVASDFTVASNVAPKYIIYQPGKCSVDFPCQFEILSVAPTGSDAIFDILYTPPGDPVGGLTTRSVFNAGAKITVPAGSTTLNETIDFDPTVEFELLGRLSCDILQVGSTIPGQCLSIVFKWRIKGT